MVDVDDVDVILLVVDPVDNPVASPPCRAQTFQLASQRAAQPVGLFRQRTEDQRQTGGADLLRTRSRSRSARAEILTAYVELTDH